MPLTDRLVNSLRSCFKKSVRGCQAWEAGAQGPECTQKKYMRILTTPLRRRLTRVAMLSRVAAAVANTARPRITVAQHFFKQLLTHNALPVEARPRISFAAWSDI